MKVLCAKIETSGFNFEGDIAKNYQIVNMHLVVTDTDHFSTVDSLYVEFKWDTKSKWSPHAECLHKQLKSQGLDLETGLVQVAEFIFKHYEAEETITLFGENVNTFMLPFLKQMFETNGLHFKFTHRNLEFSSMVFLFTGKQFLDDIFLEVGIKEIAHNNSKRDLINMLRVARTCRMIVK